MSLNDFEFISPAASLGTGDFVIDDFNTDYFQPIKSTLEDTASGWQFVDVPVTPAGPMPDRIVPIEIWPMTEQMFKNNMTQGQRDQALTEIQRREMQNQNLSVPCQGNDADMTEARLTLSKLNWQAVQLTEKHQFYEANLMRELHCLIGSLTFQMPYDDQLTFVNRRMRHYFHPLQRIGGDTAYGVALNPTIEGAKDLFVIKAAKESTKEVNFSTYHETFVGQAALNQLRYQDIYNFAYVYGGFACTTPYVTPAGEVATWCSTTDRAVNYVIYENITDSVPFADVTKTANVTTILTYYIQLMYALGAANEQFDYTHYDLHGNNILIRRLRDTVCIPIQTGNGTEYLAVSEIPTIIDYGYNHVKINGQNYGMPGHENQSVFWDASFPLHDAYRVFMYIIISLTIDKRQAELQEMTDLFHFFVEDKYTIADFFNVMTSKTLDQQFFFNILTYTPARARVNCRQVAAYIRAHYPAINNLFQATPMANLKLLSCSHGQVCESSIFKLQHQRHLGLDGYEVYNRINMIKHYNPQADILAELKISNVPDFLNRQKILVDNQLVQTANSLNEIELIEARINPINYTREQIDQMIIQQELIAYDQFTEAVLNFYVYYRLMKFFKSTLNTQTYIDGIIYLKTWLENAINLWLDNAGRDFDSQKKAQYIRSVLGIGAYGPLQIDLLPLD